MKFLFACAWVLLTASPLWLSNFQSAKQSANEQHKLILLNFSGSDWCAPCIKMKAEVFESESFSTIANKHLVLLRADFPRLKKNQLPAEQLAQNESLADAYNPEGKFPLTVLLDANGKELKRWDGYVFASQDKFLAELETTLNNQKP